MTEQLKPCPYCGSKQSAKLDAAGGEWVGLIIIEHGSVKPKVCLNCGLVYISKNVCEKIKNRRAENDH